MSAQLVMEAATRMLAVITQSETLTVCVMKDLLEMVAIVKVGCAYGTQCHSVVTN